MSKYLNKIAQDFIPGSGFSIGEFNLIEEDVKVGDNVTLKSYVELRKGTTIGDESYIDSGVSSSGYNLIGDRVRIRYKSILARGVIIEDDVFISPKLMTENLNHKGEEVGGAHIGTGEWDKKTKYRVFIGTDVTLASGIEICSGAIIGSESNVRKSITEPGIYMGNPARLWFPKKVTYGKNVIVEFGADVGSQPFTFTDNGELRVPEFGVTIGDNVWIGTKCVIMRGTERDTYLGKNVKVAQYCNIGHDSRIEDGARISAGVLLGGFSKVGKNADIAMGVTIRNRVSVGQLSLIGQDANVVEDIPANVIAYGNPCRVIKKRYTLLEYTLRRLRG